MCDFEEEIGETLITIKAGRSHQDDSNDTPQPICQFQVSFPLLRIRINQDKP